MGSKYTSRPNASKFFPKQQKLVAIEVVLTEL